MKGRISICSILSLYFVISCRMGLSFAVNVATGKSYNQSSNYSSISYPATDAADDNSRDCFRSSTAGNAQEWWEVDLGRTYPVSVIRVVTDTGNYLYPFTITVDGKYCARLPDDNKTSVYVACSSVIYGQVVRITRTRYGQLRLCDFQVNVPSAAYYCEAGRWGASCQYSCSNKCGGGPGTNFCYRYTGGCYEENVAAGKNRQSRTLSTLNPPRHASNGYAGDCYWSDVILDTNEWWEVNLGGKYPVSNIHITASYSYLYPFTITVDGQLCVNETTAQQRTNPSVACSSVMYGQRVRITRTTRGRLQLCEVDINVPSGITKCPVGRHGEQCQLTCSNNCGEGPGTNFCYQNTGECYEVNVATGKTYSESSYIYPSSYAADENINTCFRTYPYGNWQDWWEVDLGRKYPVHQFHITSLSSSYSSYLYPFTITVDGQMCVNETSFNSATFPTLSCPATIYGQVVRIASSPSRQFVLCEFEINVPSGVSRCEAGRWGPQCNHHCSNTCGGGPGNNFCFQGTGDCYDGCVEGWWGDRCQHRCNRDCEHHACQQGTGNCAGCRAGYHGDNCGDSCSTIASQCQQCTQGGSCTACSGNFHLPACTECSDGFYLKNPDAVHCTECAWRCDNNKPCNKTTGDCDKCSPGWEGLKCLQQVDSGASSGSEKLIGPVVGAVVGVGLLLAVVVVAAICWRSRSQMWVAKAETTTAMSSIAEPVAAPGNVYTVPPGAETSSAAAQDDSPYEIRDPPNPYERLRVYSNMTFEREAQSNVDLLAASKASDEKIYVNVPASAPAKRS